LRATERAAIINYYKATWALVLNLERVDLVKKEIDYFNPDDPVKDRISELELRRYAADAELILNKTKEDIVNLQYLKEVSESELAFFFDENDINDVIKRLNLSLSKFDRDLSGTITQLLLVSRTIDEKMRSGKSSMEVTIELRKSRSDILASWDEERRKSSIIIRTFNLSLKKVLHKRLRNLTL
jgi:DNA repair ATPase RecN